MKKNKRLQRFVNKIYYNLVDGSVVFLVIIIIFSFCYLTYSLAYKQGKEDGYASGYMNRKNGVYEERASSNVDRGFVESVSSTANLLSKNIFVSIRNNFDTSAYKDEILSGYDYIYIEGEASERQVEALQNKLNQLPTNLLQSFVSDDWTLIFTDRDITINYAGKENYQAAGLIQYDDNTITITSSTNSIDHTVSHEFGHYLDYLCNSPSQEEEWAECYRKEWEGLYSICRSFHGIGTASEYFAEVFAWYIENPEELKRCCPLSYKFVDTLVAQYL